MLDTGAQGEFISPSLAKRLGATVEHGRFGVAVEAFGRETPLTQRVRRVELALPGQHPDSLLSQDFVTRWDFTISPGSLSDDYDLLLGTRFIRHFRLHLMFNEPCTIRLTAEDGRVTQMQEAAGRSSGERNRVEQEAQQVATVAARGDAEAAVAVAETRDPPRVRERRRVERGAGAARGGGASRPGDEHGGAGAAVAVGASRERSRCSRCSHKDSATAERRRRGGAQQPGARQGERGGSSRAAAERRGRLTAATRGAGASGATGAPADGA